MNLHNPSCVDLFPTNNVNSFQKTCDSENGLSDFHSRKKQKDSLEIRAVLLKFSLDREISGVAVHSIHQNSEKWWRSGNDFEAVLVSFSCYDHGANASEAVRKIATDRKEYHKCSSCVIICLIAKMNIPINQ